MAFRVTIRTSPTSTHILELDNQGVVTAGGGPTGIVLSQLPDLVDLVNRSMGILTSTGWVSLEIEVT